MRVIRAGVDINISETSLNTLDRQRQRDSRDCERGGILLGQVSKDFGTVLVTTVTLPGPNDRATRTSFYRNAAWAQALVEQEFNASGGRTVYLGEWHTHPSKRGHPSSVDESMIRSQFRRNTLCTPYLLLVIVALDEYYIGLFDGKCLHC